MTHKTPRVDKTKWRSDAKNILADMRLFQDAITAKYGYEGFSPVRFSVNGLHAGKITSLLFTADDTGVTVSLIDDGTTIDTMLIPHQKD